MEVPLKKAHIICNWCSAEIGSSEQIKFKDSDKPIQYYPGKQNQIDYCDEWCENKVQTKCEHNNKATDKATYVECLGCGKISQDSRL